MGGSYVPVLREMAQDGRKKPVEVPLQRATTEMVSNLPSCRMSKHLVSRPIRRRRRKQCKIVGKTHLGSRRHG